MKTFNAILVFIFVLSAALQYNDPDPYLWVPIYLYAAVLCAYAFKKTYLKTSYIIGIAAYAIAAIYYVVVDDGVISWVVEHHSESIVGQMQATKPWIEKTREFGGLMICLLALIGNMIYFERHKSTVEPVLNKNIGNK